MIDLVDEIHQSFDNTKSLEVRAIFLDIPKAFDKGMARWVNFQAETEWCARYVAAITTKLLK